MKKLTLAISARSLILISLLTCGSCNRSGTDSQVPFDPWPQKIFSPTCDSTSVYYIEEYDVDSLEIEPTYRSIKRIRLEGPSSPQTVILGGTGFSEAAIAPNGERLAFIGPGSVVHILSFRTQEGVSLEVATNLCWYDNETLLYSVEGVGTLASDAYVDSTWLVLDSGAHFVAASTGGMLAFVRYSGSDSSFVCIANADGLKERVLARFGHEVRHPAWSTDGATIAISCFENPDSPSIRFLDASTGTTLSLMIERAIEPFYSPDGSHLVYVQLGNKASGERDFIGIADL